MTSTYNKSKVSIVEKNSGPHVFKSMKGTLVYQQKARPASFSSMEQSLATGSSNDEPLSCPRTFAERRDHDISTEL